MLSKRMRITVLGVLLAAVGTLVVALVLAQRTTRVYVVEQSLPRYTQLTEEHITPRTVPRTAAEEVDAITDPARAVGRYLSAPVQRGTMLHSRLLLDELPCDRVFTQTGRCIPRGREAVLVPVPATVGGMVNSEDLVNVWALHANRQEIQILLQKVPPLGLVNNSKELALALTPDELALLAPYLNGNGGNTESKQVARASLLFSLTTASSSAYDRLASFPLRPQQQAGGEYRLVDDESFLPPDPSTYLNTDQAPRVPAGDETASTDRK